MKPRVHRCPKGGSVKDVIRVSWGVGEQHPDGKITVIAKIPTGGSTWRCTRCGKIWGRKLPRSMR